MELCPNTRICMHYGLTEAVNFYRIQYGKNKITYYWQAISRSRDKSINESGEKVRVNESGLLAIKSPSVMQDIGGIRLTDKAVIKNWLITDDIGKFDNDGYIILTGRKKDILNIGGLKFFPQEVENNNEIQGYY